MHHFSDRLAHLRTIAGLSGRELDRLAGLGEGHTRMIETGERPNVEVETATKLSDVLGCTLDWLLVGRGKEPAVRAVRGAVEVARERYAKNHAA